MPYPHSNPLLSKENMSSMVQAKLIVLAAFKARLGQGFHLMIAGDQH